MYFYRKFPWLLEVYDLQAYNFYKVIEVLIRAEDGLSRDIIKHLNQVTTGINGVYQENPGSCTFTVLTSRFR